MGEIDERLERLIQRRWKLIDELKALRLEIEMAENELYKRELGGLSVRALSAIKRIAWEHNLSETDAESPEMAQQLANFTEAELMRTPLVGSVTLKEIEVHLRGHGLKFAKH